MQEIILNGKPLPLPQPLSITTLLAQQGVDGRKVAVEVDRQIIPKSAYEKHQLLGGEVVEVIGFIGGG
jgi:thiamine biosynthesis protein ThiS